MGKQKSRIEESLAGRRGRPKTEGKNLQDFAELKTQGNSSDIAAKAIDMNRETYRQAKAVVDSGNRDVIEQMASNKKSRLRTCFLPGGYSFSPSRSRCNSDSEIRQK